MRGIDEETGEYRGPSRSQRRREALDVLGLAGQLAGLSDAELARLPVPEALLPHIAQARRITSHIARKRELAYLAKQMRREDEEVLDALRDALDASGETARREIAAMYRAEEWRERLITEGDAALGELLASHPDADRQALRQLVRNAASERGKGKPPRAQRELFRMVRTLLVEGMATDGGSGAATTPGDE